MKFSNLLSGEMLYFNPGYTELCPQIPNWLDIGPENNLMWKRWHALSWTNIDQMQWHITRCCMYYRNGNSDDNVDNNNDNNDNGKEEGEDEDEKEDLDLWSLFESWHVTSVMTTLKWFNDPSIWHWLED